MNDDIVIVDCIRTPMGKAKQGVFRHTRAETLSAHLMQGLIERQPNLPIEAIDDIYWGCVQQTKEQGYNIARNAWLLTGLSHQTPGMTVNRLCGSSMEALHLAYASILAKRGQVYVVGGVEHMGHVPMTHGVDFHPNLSKYMAAASASMGLTAEFLAQRHQISREEQDVFAYQSHQRAYQASVDRLFETEILGIEGHNQLGNRTLVTTDEVIRADAKQEALQALKPVFHHEGTVTAGNASALADGASAMLIMNRAKATQFNLPILASVQSISVTGCEPAIMGLGPVLASKKILESSRLTFEDIDLVEFNEAFAAQTLACIKKLELNEIQQEKINIKGGAIALGHPLGCSGTRICTTLIHSMQQRQAEWGLASMCIGMGQGIATLFKGEP
jgi:acetyl-CoA acyltransferase